MRSPKRMLILALMLALVSGFANRTVNAAPSLHFSDLPGVFEMFLPPPAPTPIPIWGADLPEPEIPFIPALPVPTPTPMPTPPPPLPTPTPVPVPTAIPDLIPGPPTATAPPHHIRGFADVAGHWALDAILFAHDRGMVNYQNNNARPNAPITRGEFAFALEAWISVNYFQLQSLGFTYDGLGLNVVGVPYGHPMRPSIESLARFGLVGGDVDFLPDEYVQRQEAARILLNLFLRLPNSRFNEFYFAMLDADNVLSRYNDQSRVSAWARDAVAVMTDNGFMTGSGGSFRPQASLTRAEAYVVFQNIELELLN